MIRFLLILAVWLAIAPPARADDISAAGRGVVRVVVITFGEDGEIAGFGHGSGFAVAPNRIVTNAHVVDQAQESKNVSVGVVPSEGAQATRARIVAVDPARDLALLELEQGALPPIPLYIGPLADGAPVAALGYPGNVDLATARSAEDYIVPLPPTRSVGIFSNVRPINGITTLLHTANIARGHSGGPLLDQCGRVLGVNTLITRNQEGDSTFAFAVGNREVTTFLREARQPFQAVATECVGMADRLRQDQERTAAEEQRRQAEAAARRQQARDRAMAQVVEARETRLAVAVLLLVLSLLAFGGAGIMLVKSRQKAAIALGGAGAALLIGAVVVFFTRPGLSDVEARLPAQEDEAAESAPTAYAGRNSCQLVADRSRVTVSATETVPLEWSETGCVNQRTQYARNGDVWTRILVPDGEQAVSVLEFRPASGEYVVTRYLLDSSAMSRVRAMRRGVDVKSCTADQEARTVLADQQREIRALLPQLPNERLVYSCRNDGATPAASGLQGGTG
ncbi:MAG TPA: serine protease [Allosphingosinicella sp.]|nr:serine protease [Allosphingosinicella sp.]